jgi:hypothetical protein
MASKAIDCFKSRLFCNAYLSRDDKSIEKESSDALLEEKTSREMD